jgi:formate hydrogenlyase subunit 4
MTVSFIHVAVHVVLALALPPLLLGVINRTKALIAGRIGPPLFQPYYDFIKLLRKGTVLSQTTTWVFLAGPAVAFVTTLLAALLVPLGGHAAPIAFDGDFIVFAYALGLGRFFTVTAALDTGSSFEGMGGAREVTFSCLAEPALFFGLLVLAHASGSYSLTDMLGPNVAFTWSIAGAALAAVLVSWFVVLLAENSRIPFDDPNKRSAVRAIPLRCCDEAVRLRCVGARSGCTVQHIGPVAGMVRVRRGKSAACHLRRPGRVRDGATAPDAGAEPARRGLLGVCVRRGLVGEVS